MDENIKRFGGNGRDIHGLEVRCSPLVLEIAGSSAIGSGRDCLFPESFKYEFSWSLCSGNECPRAYLGTAKYPLVIGNHKF